MSLILLSLFTILIVLGSIYVGFGLYRFMKSSRPGTIIEPSGVAIGALMGLLAFMLAFSFSMGTNRLDARKQALLKEINAIGTLNLRADILPEGEKEEYKSLIAQYVKMLVDLPRNTELLEGVIVKADEISKELWKRSFAYAEANRLEVTSLALLEATNEVIDTFEERVFQSNQHLPIIIWAALIGMSVVSMMAMGYQLGHSRKMSHTVNILMALTFATPLVLIEDLDKYDEGFFMIPDEPMERLYEGLLTSD
jgi:hypothetical protein